MNLGLIHSPRLGDRDSSALPTDCAKEIAAVTVRSLCEYHSPLGLKWASNGSSVNLGEESLQAVFSSAGRERLRAKQDTFYVHT